MSKIEPLSYPGNVFDPEAVAVSGMAYERAVNELHAGGLPELVREIIAKGILAAAVGGERDPDRLFKSALASIGLPAG
jgi:hypothetical protein